jgi:phosphoribosylformylglycinamidine synthase
LAPLELPIAHGEGKFVPANEQVRKALWENDQVALTYIKPDGTPAGGEFPFNPNGSTDDIAGICDETGLVFGLMPHPERHVTPLQHPAWTSRREKGDGPGLRLFTNAVKHALLVGSGT